MDSESDSEQSGAEIEEKTKRIVENSPKMTPEKKSTPKKSSIENNLQKKSPNAKNTPTPQKDLKKKGSLSPQQILDEEDSPLKKSPKYDILDEEDDEKNVDNDDSKQEEDEIDAKKEKENEDDEKIDLDKEEEGTPKIQSKKRHRAPTKFDKELEESERAKFKRDRDLEIPIYEGENKQTSYSQIANLFNASFVKKRQELVSFHFIFLFFICQKFFTKKNNSSRCLSKMYNHKSQVQNLFKNYMMQRTKRTRNQLKIRLHLFKKSHQFHLQSQKIPQMTKIWSLKRQAREQIQHKETNSYF